jgi:Leucine-rich repeat (LRR) protein
MILYLRGLMNLDSIKEWVCYVGHLDCNQETIDPSLIDGVSTIYAKLLKDLATQIQSSSPKNRFKDLAILQGAVTPEKIPDGINLEDPYALLDPDRLNDINTVEEQEISIHSNEWNYAKYQDLREFTLHCFHYFTFEQQCAILGLDTWQTEGFKQDACKEVIQCFLTQSEILDLSDCCLTSLPDCIFTKSFVFTTLNIELNELHELPAAFVELTRLKKINVRDNQIQEFPEVLLRCPQLEEINLSNNQIHRISGPLSNLIHLKTFNFLNNYPLLEVTDEIFKLPRLCTNGVNLREFHSQQALR